MLTIKHNCSLDDVMPELMIEIIKGNHAMRCQDLAVVICEVHSQLLSLLNVFLQ
jgi:hypothetical protein